MNLRMLVLGLLAALVGVGIAAWGITKLTVEPAIPSATTATHAP